MDDNEHCESGRYKQDQYRPIDNQWMIPLDLMKDHHALSMEFMNILAERESAIQEMNTAIAEKRAALAERDMVFLQRDIAISERDKALVDRDSTVKALNYQQNYSVNGYNIPTPTPKCGIPRQSKHHLPPMERSTFMTEAPCTSREMSETPKSRMVRRKKEFPPNNQLKPRKSEKAGSNLNRRRPVTVANPFDHCTEAHDVETQPGWNLGPTQVNFNDSSMAAPIRYLTIK